MRNNDIEVPNPFATQKSSQGQFELPDSNNSKIAG